MYPVLSLVFGQCDLFKLERILRNKEMIIPMFEYFYYRNITFMKKNDFGRYKIIHMNDGLIPYCWYCWMMFRPFRTEITSSCIRRSYWNVHFKARWSRYPLKLYNIVTTIFLVVEIMKF